MPTISFITTCKGRLEHVKETLPLVVAQTPDQVIVVDYGCPQKVGDWVEENFPSVLVVRVTNDPGFIVSRARNAGLASCNTDFVCFIDADIKIGLGFVDWIKSNCEPNSYYRASPVNGELDKETWGTCVVPVAIVKKAGGYDEMYTGWGGEDDDLYHRLGFIGITKLFYPAKFVEPIRHNEVLRMAEYEEKNRDMHHIVNELYTIAKHQVMSMDRYLVHPAKDTRQKIMSDVKGAVDKWKASGMSKMPSVKFKISSSGWLPKPYKVEKSLVIELSVKIKKIY